MAKNQFIPLLRSKQGFKIAEFFPTGKAWDGKNDDNTNLGALILALGGEFNRLESLIQTTNKELDIDFTDELITEWEASVGIPDSCFLINESISVRIAQIITKLRNVRLQTVQDYKDLALLFGVAVQVFPGVPVGFSATDKEKRFSITVDLPGTFSGDFFPYPNFFPIPFVIATTGLIQCLFTKIKPANVQIIFTNGANELGGAEIVVVTTVTGNLGTLFDDAPGLFDDAPGLFDDA